VHTVAIVLQACFGGNATLFRVQLLRERSFRFLVASKSVGLNIYNQAKFSDTNFEFFINLWGDGGPNWLTKEKKFYKEQEDSWQTIPFKSSRVSAFDRLKFPNSSSSNSNLVPIRMVFQRIKFPLNNGSTVKPSYVHALTGGAGVTGLNGDLSPRANLLTGNLVWRPKIKTTPSLPGLLPYMKFKSFKTPNLSAWPVETIQKWFKAHGPSALIIMINSFKGLFRVSSSPLTSPLAPSNSPLCTVNPGSLTPSVSSKLEFADQMANIPIDPSEFMPAGFQVL
jgi:hypothetical protein